MTTQESAQRAAVPAKAARGARKAAGPARQFDAGPWPIKDEALRRWLSGSLAVVEETAREAVILGGDYLLAKAAELCAPLGTDALSEQAQILTRMVRGQVRETLDRGSAVDPEEYYLSIIGEAAGGRPAHGAAPPCHRRSPVAALISGVAGELGGRAVRSRSTIGPQRVARRFGSRRLARSV